MAATGSLINNMGNVEVYDLLTVADDNLKIDITEINTEHLIEFYLKVS